MDVNYEECHCAKAGVWLIKELSKHPMPVSKLVWNGELVGFTRQELQRAARVKHAVRSKRVGCGVWVWILTGSRTCSHYRHLGLRMARASKDDKAPKATKATKTLGWGCKPSKATKATKAHTHEFWFSNLNWANSFRQNAMSSASRGASRLSRAN